MGDSLGGGAQRVPGHHFRGEFRERHAGRLRDVWHGARRARVHLEDVQLVLVDRVLDVDQPDDLGRLRQVDGAAAYPILLALRDDIRRESSLRRNKAENTDCPPGRTMHGAAPPRRSSAAMPTVAARREASPSKRAARYRTSSGKSMAGVAVHAAVPILSNGAASTSTIPSCRRLHRRCCRKAPASGWRSGSAP